MKMTALRASQERIKRHTHLETFPECLNLTIDQGPYRRLLVGILNQALQDFCGMKRSNDTPGDLQANRRSAQHWFRCNSSDLFSFLTVCTLLDICPTSLRAELIPYHLLKLRLRLEQYNKIAAGKYCQ